jgi:CubicO group peptidase (beta-lactamase class C family)
VSTSTEFRIASMTKSFVAMAALKLRDQGKLALDAPASNYLTELRKVGLPTTDSPPLTVRQLMTMSTGLPEDNPWGDRQMQRDNAEIERIVGTACRSPTRRTRPTNTATSATSCSARSSLKVAGMRFQDYVTRQILLPLGMNSTRWEYSKAAPGKLALGSLEPRRAWQRSRSCTTATALR